MSDSKSPIEEIPLGSTRLGSAQPDENDYVFSGDDDATVLSRPRQGGSSVSGVVARSQAMNSLVGELVGHFRIENHIGVGGMGAVFLARDLSLERPVALKILPPDQAKDPHVVVRFQEEARAAAKLDHENIARVYFVGEDRGVHFIAFEYIEGTNIRDLLGQRERLSVDEAVDFTLQIAGALVHASERGVVHRDIKPSNIVITPSGRAKLVDMGLARNFERSGDIDLTQSGATLGTFDYISPEQANDPRTADIRSDIYSLGCTLYHMLTGEPPFPSGTVLQKLLKHKEGAAPDPRDVNPYVPEQLALLVRRMMAKEPDHRPSSAPELMKELLPLATELGLHSTSPEGLIWGSQHHDNERAWLPWTVTICSFMCLGLLSAALWNPWLGDSPENAESGIETAEKDQAKPKSKSSSQTAADPSTRASETDSTGSEGTGEVSTVPAIVQVGSAEEFARALKGPVDVIELTADIKDLGEIQIEDRKLKIVAAPGVRPRLGLSADAVEGDQFESYNLFHCIGSQVEFHGVDFVLDSSLLDIRMAALLVVEASDLLLEECRFLQLGIDRRKQASVHLWAIKLVEPAISSPTMTSNTLRLNRCFFFRGDGGINCMGYGDISLQECTVLPQRSAFLMRGGLNAASDPAAISIEHSSFLTEADSPLFDIRTARVTFQANFAVISHQDGPGRLIEVDEKASYTFSGMSNVYHGIDVFQAPHKPQSGEAIVSYESWRDWEGVEDSQSLSYSLQSSTWLTPLAEAVDEFGLANPLLINAFRLKPSVTELFDEPPGSRYVIPWGRLYFEGDSALAGLAPESLVAQTASPPVASTQADSVNRPAAPPEPIIGTNEPKGRMDRQRPNPPVPGDATATNNGTTGRNILIVDPTDPMAFRTLEDALAKATNGTEIEIRVGHLVLDEPIELSDLHIVISGTPGNEPTIELNIDDSLALGGSAPHLLAMRRGSLELKHLDFRVVVNPDISTLNWSLAQSHGADINVEGCSITFVSTEDMDSSVIHLQGTAGGSMPTMPNEKRQVRRPEIQFTDSFVRGAGALIWSRPAGPVRLDIENCALDLQKSLVVSEGGTDSYLPENANDIEISRCTVRVHRDLLHMATVDNRGWLPPVWVKAEECLFIGTEQKPWLYFRSPLTVDEIRRVFNWKGINNDYCGMNNFLLAESENMPSGSSTEPLLWSMWQNDSSSGRTEVGPRFVNLAVLMMAQPLINGTPAWERSLETLERIREANSEELRGADVTLIPSGK